MPSRSYFEKFGRLIFQKYVRCIYQHNATKSQYQLHIPCLFASLREGPFRNSTRILIFLQEILFKFRPKKKRPLKSNGDNISKKISAQFQQSCNRQSQKVTRVTFKSYLPFCTGSKCIRISSWSCQAWIDPNNVEYCSLDSLKILNTDSWDAVLFAPRSQQQ